MDGAQTTVLNLHGPSFFRTPGIREHHGSDAVIA